MRARTTSAIVMAVMLVALCASADPAEPTMLEVFKDGEVALSFRYRFEGVDDDAFSEDAKASTLRSRLSFSSGAYRNMSFFVEAQDVRELFADDFNSGGGTSPGRSQYPVIADPQGTRINQAYVDWAGIEDTVLRVGRQRVELDNKRFVGGVEFRQNGQTFDAVSVKHSRDRITTFYTFVNNVQTIFGEGVAAGKREQGATHLLNVQGRFPEVGNLTGYFYHIDDSDVASFSTTTFGARFTGARELGEYGLSYQVELAFQQDAANNPSSYDAGYRLFVIGVERGGYNLDIGREVLEGNDTTLGEAFRTPLATVHAFNGWADKFVVIPDVGLEDTYVKFQANIEKVIVEARYHHFEEEAGGSVLGNELDLRVGRPFGKHLRGDLIYTTFDGDSGLSDVKKIWAMLTVTL